ncbi:MAG: hypothetical protein KBS59_08465 [Clostridiales bacterium]|nr:hypothetical protein [Clostridiales bacterium]
MENIYKWSEDMYPLVKKAFEERYASRISAIGNVCGIVNQENPTYTIHGLGGYGELAAYTSSLTSATGDNVFKKVVTPTERALAVPVKYKDANTDIVEEAKRTGIRLADSAFMTVLNDFYRVFGDAYSETDCPDGVAWASASHKVSTADGADTYSNLIASELSVSAITNAIAAANALETADGTPFVGNFDMLFVSPELEATARNICGKDAAVSPVLHPETGLGGNPVYGMNYMVAGAGSLGFSGTEWAIADSNLLKEIFKLVYVTEPTVLISPKEDPLCVDFVAYVDFAFGFSDARPIVFSTGEGDDDDGNGGNGAVT